MKALDNRFYVKFIQLEIGLLVIISIITGNNRKFYGSVNQFLHFPPPGREGWGFGPLKLSKAPPLTGKLLC